MIGKFNEKITDSKINSRGRRTGPAAYHSVFQPLGGNNCIVFTRWEGWQ